VKCPHFEFSYTTSHSNNTSVQVFLEVVKKMLENPELLQQAIPGRKVAPTVQLRPTAPSLDDDDEGGCC
jgi:hypothetical protein